MNDGPLDAVGAEQTAPVHVVLLSPEGRGAVATILVAGPQAAAIVGRNLIWRSGNSMPLEIRPLGRIFLGRWQSAVGEEVVVCRRNSSELEIHCHGGAAAARRLIDDLTKGGCIAVPWRDWIRRNEPNAIRAEARILLAEARTEHAAAILLDQYNGALEQSLARIATDLESGRAAAAAEQIEELLRWASVGLHLVEPWRVVLAGPPNVGKSSLINRLIGFQRSIVHNQPGTTRDVVGHLAALDGWPIELTDTAGLRTSIDPLEMAGVERARGALASCDAVVFVFDATQPWKAELESLLSERPGAIVLHNKSDLLSPSATSDNSLPDRPSGLLTSALSGQGIESLVERIIRHLIPSSPLSGIAIPFRSSQVALLREALAAAQRCDIPAALQAIHQTIGASSDPPCVPIITGT